MAEEEGAKAAGPIRMVAIENMMENIRYKAQILVRTNKVDSGITDSGILGFAAGLATAIILIVIPVLLVR
jgi:tetrahydromethanopterin S-methyltransferase subunit F